MAVDIDLSRTASVMVYNIFEAFEYVVPSFQVLSFDLSRCRVAVMGLGEEGLTIRDRERVDCLIRTSTLHGEAFPQLVVPIRSCDIEVDKRRGSHLFCSMIEWETCVYFRYQRWTFVSFPTQILSFLGMTYLSYGNG